MKSYDIYLKKHLTEAKLFIQTLPYRDSFSVDEKLVLDAMLGYYVLQKLIAINNKSELVAEVSQIIRDIQEVIDTSMSIRSDADFVAQCDNRLDTSKIEIGVQELSALLYQIYTADDSIGICISDIETDVFGSVHVDNAMEVVSSITSTLSQKWLTTGEKINLFCQIAENAIVYLLLKDGNETSIDVSIETVLRRYRILCEIDSIPLHDLNANCLRELDYIELT